MRLTMASAKGGVGKTTTAINLASAFSRFGQDVVLVELDLPMANVGDFLEFDRRLDPTLHDVLAGEAALSAAIHPAPGGFDVVPSGTDLAGFAEARPERIPDELDVLDRYDVVLFDTGAGVSHESAIALGLADWTVLVSTPRLAAMRDAEKTVELAEIVEGTVDDLVLTRSGSGNSPPAAVLANHLGLDLLGHVPEHDAIPASQDAGVPVIEYAPDSEASQVYLTIADRLLRRRPPELGLATGGRGVGSAGTPTGPGSDT